MIQWNLASFFVWLFSLQVLLLDQDDPKTNPFRHLKTLILAVLTLIASFSTQIEIALSAIGVITLLHSLSARFLWPAAILSFGAAFLHWRQFENLAFLASYFIILYRAGIWPFHKNVIQLTIRAPEAQVRQLATLLPLVYIHLRYLDHLPMATWIAPWAILAGAFLTFLSALATLGAKSLNGFFSNATLTHAGMLMMAVAASGQGHHGAALFAAITMSLSLGGLATMVRGVQERLGSGPFSEMGGIASTFPKLTIGFLFFGAAGVALPGTAGFIADDLLLHALWSGSVLGTILTILASGILAIATWMTCTKTFFGKPRIWKSIAIFEDLDFRDRILAFSIAFTLILLGFAPSILMGPANQILN